VVRPLHQTHERLSVENYGFLLKDNTMTKEEMHNHNRQWALSGLSYEAVCTDDFIIDLRNWFTKWLEMAYDAGYNNAKKGEL